MILVVMKSRGSVLVKSKSLKRHVIPGCALLSAHHLDSEEHQSPPDGPGRGSRREPGSQSPALVSALAGSPESPPHSPPPFTRPAGSCSSAVRRLTRPRPLLRFLFAPDEGEKPRGPRGPGPESAGLQFPTGPRLQYATLSPAS